jgi:limonene-1,2-epoxide hydrolase
MVDQMQNEKTLSPSLVQASADQEPANQSKLAPTSDTQCDSSLIEQLIEKLINLYATGVNQSNVEKLGAIYAENCVFEDPLHRIEGLKSIQAYMLNMYENVGSYEMTVTNQSIAGNRAFLSWTLSFCHPKLNRNRAIEIVGISELIIEDRITSHRDYFDVGAMLYEHIPLMGRLIKRVKKQAGQ